MATAAFRFGHSLIRNMFPRMSGDYDEKMKSLELKVCCLFDSTKI